MSHFPLAIAFPIVFFLFTGFLFFWIFQKKVKSKYAEKMGLNKQQYMDLSKKFKNIQEELSRKNEIAEKIPVIVRRLSENLPKNAIPRIVVRAAMELFHASKAGYFARSEDSNEFTLLDRSGYPPDLMIIKKGRLFQSMIFSFLREPIHGNPLSKIAGLRLILPPPFT
jgi:hypothetical protein